MAVGGFKRKLPMSAALRQGGEGVVKPPKARTPSAEKGSSLDLGSSLKGPKMPSLPKGPSLPKVGGGLPKEPKLPKFK